MASKWRPDPAKMADLLFAPPDAEEQPTTPKKESLLQLLESPEPSVDGSDDLSNTVSPAFSFKNRGSIERLESPSSSSTERVRSPCQVRNEASSPDLMEVTYDTNKSNLCCVGKNHVYLSRCSGALTPYPEAYGPIKAFVEKINAGKVVMAINELSDEQLKRIKTIYQVNVVNGLRETMSTTFFAPVGDLNPDAEAADKLKLACFAQADPPIAMVHDGELSYLAFWCKEHDKTYRVGRYHLKWFENKTWATFGKKEIDKIIGHPEQPMSPFGPMKPV